MGIEFFNAIEMREVFYVLKREKKRVKRDERVRDEREREREREMYRGVKRELTF
jgi:hypothetical protein